MINQKYVVALHQEIRTNNLKHKVMKTNFRKVKVSMNTDVQAIPSRIKGAVSEFNYLNQTDIEIKEFCGNWDGMQFNAAILYIHKDFVEKFKSEYPELF